MKSKIMNRKVSSELDIETPSLKSSVRPSLSLIVNSNSKIILSNLDDIFSKVVFDKISMPCSNVFSVDCSASVPNVDSNASPNNVYPNNVSLNENATLSNSSIKRFFFVIDNYVILDLIDQVQSRKYDARQNLTKITEKLRSDMNINMSVNVNFLTNHADKKINKSSNSTRNKAGFVSIDAIDKVFGLSITSVTSILSGTKVVKPIQNFSEFNTLIKKISGRRVNLCTSSIVHTLNCNNFIVNDRDPMNYTNNLDSTSSIVSDEDSANIVSIIDSGNSEYNNNTINTVNIDKCTKKWKIFSKIILKIKRMNEEEIDNLYNSISEDHMYDSAFLLSPAMEPYICYVSSYDGMTGMPVRKIVNILRNIRK